MSALKLPVESISPGCDTRYDDWSTNFDSLTCFTLLNWPESDKGSMDRIITVRRNIILFIVQEFNSIISQKDMQFIIKDL
jgi:hypothetical protein